MKALIIVDIQYDFLPGGALAVAEGDLIIPQINSLIPAFDCIVLTQDWHPQNHASFASNNPGKQPYDMAEMDYGPQVLWPDHCVQGTKGAEFHHTLNVDAANLIIRKGFRPHIDSYSTFFENDRKTTTGLHGYLQERGVNELYLCGIATDFCVNYSALDAAKLGYKVHVVEDAVKGIDIDNSVAESIDKMQRAGAIFTNTKALLTKLG